MMPVLRQVSEKVLLIVLAVLVMYPMLQDWKKAEVVSMELVKRAASVVEQKTVGAPMKMIGVEQVPWRADPVWDGEYFGWVESLEYRDPKLENRPSYVVLVSAMLRTVLQKEVKFWGRNPYGSVRVHLRKKWGTQWDTQTTLPTNTTDYTTVITFAELTPSTEYQYVIQLQLNGTWYTHYEDTLETFPTEGQLIPSEKPLVFGFGSCITPNRPGTMTGESLKLLAGWGKAVKFFLFIGDFIYFWDELPHVTPEYNRYYYRRLMTKEVVAAMRAYPWFFQFDDHEVHNDYASEGDPSTHPYHAPAMAAWDNMIARANPAPNPPFPIPPKELPFVRWYSYSYGNAHFFVADVRSFKVNTKDLTGQLLGEHQMKALKHWVTTNCKREKLAWCFFISPTIFNHGSYRTDLWFGNMKEQKEVTAMFSAPGLAPISILSGDSHMAGVYEIATNVHEFTCSPVDAFGLFYPWSVPPRFAKFKKGRRPKNFDMSWPALGDLPPPKAFHQHVAGHLRPAGFNCIVEVNTSVSNGMGTV
eukprot:TRINITY_DN4022_c0_g1_i2.p1 TRINITY_DN4022_c0_g1~~TRINITY_DN4022_c0_g1_i2.p1  ORF type:complete len:529 (+),score=106.53 TRINITY_DN4022_c0_g1_i2:83-1669(+)